MTATLESRDRATEPIDRILARHRAFWGMAPTAQPLVSVGPYAPLRSREPFDLADGTKVREGQRLRPDLIDPATIANGWSPYPAVSGSLLRSSTAYDLCWTEAICGCDILWRSGHVWAEPFLDAPARVDAGREAADSAWFDKLLEMARILVHRAEGRHPVAQPLLRGPVDMAAAALGDEQLCWALADDRAGLARLLEHYTGLFIQVADAWRRRTPAFHGGHALYGIWAPGTVLRSQCDNAGLLSPSIYRQLLLPCDERICASVDFALIHTHSCFLPMVAEVLLDMRGLAAIQVSLDFPGGPTVEALLPTLRLINERRPLIITGPMTRAELDRLSTELSPRGLSLQVSLRGEGDPWLPPGSGC